MTLGLPQCAAHVAAPTTQSPAVHAICYKPFESVCFNRIKTYVFRQTRIHFFGIDLMWFAHSKHNSCNPSKSTKIQIKRAPLKTALTADEMQEFEFDTHVQYMTVLLCKNNVQYRHFFIVTIFLIHLKGNRNYIKFIYLFFAGFCNMDITLSISF